VFDEVIYIMRSAQFNCGIFSADDPIFQAAWRYRSDGEAPAEPQLGLHSQLGGGSYEVDVVRCTIRRAPAAEDRQSWVWTRIG
ncbi:MAG TPA: hypothetical protein VN157_14490, partial [Caulobacter sp.]|nr:hypothetical protein [Caulobacter sp.]